MQAKVESAPSATLIVEFARGDAIEERLLLAGIGLLEVAEEIPGAGKFLGLGRRSSSLPRLITPNTQRAAVGRLRVAFGAQEALVDVEMEFAKLGSAEADRDTVGIGGNEIEAAAPRSSVSRPRRRPRRASFLFGHGRVRGHVADAEAGLARYLFR